ncbi:MAG: GlcNAc-transferase family protein, partial [Minisyncoccia bacterium]
KNDKKKHAYPTKQKPTYTRKNYWTAERIEFSDRQRPQPEQSSTVLAGFVFANGSIVNEIPYDPEISFFGEEICFSMRAWTRGWDIYSPSKVIVYHFYLRTEYKKVWHDKNVRPISWEDLEKYSKEKQMRVLCGIEKGIYGAGDYRHLKLYEKLVGYNFKEIYGLTDLDNGGTI